MNSIKKDSFYINEIAKLSDSGENYQTYSILPEYGLGSFTIHRIIPSLSIAYNNFILYNKIINQNNNYQLFSASMLKVNYCLKGKMLAYNNVGRVCISNSGSTAYYVGIENIFTVEHFAKHYESITLFGYINEIINTFETIFSIKKETFSSFFSEINEDNDFMVIKSNTTVLRLVNEIRESFLDKSIDKLKLKSIELFLYELKNIKQNKKSIEQYYNRSTIDKVVCIEQYISSNIDKRITINDLCVKFNITLDTLKRCFKQMYSESVYAYLKNKRMKKGKELLEQSNKSITEIALTCGYSNHHSFGKAFKQTYKVPPREIRKTSLTS